MREWLNGLFYFRWVSYVQNDCFINETQGISHPEYNYNTFIQVSWQYSDDYWKRQITLKEVHSYFLKERIVIKTNVLEMNNNCMKSIAK
jgi:hypothetical protein